MTPLVDIDQSPERKALRALVREVATRELVPHLEAWERAGLSDGRT